MAKIPYNPTKQAVRAEPSPTVGADFGTQNLRAQSRLGDTVQSISKQAGAITTDYAVKNKNADMKADEMNYMVKRQSVLLNAKEAANKTSDSKEIARIYKDAQSDIEKWVVGNDDNGNPNIRWGDQVAGIRGDANQFRVQLDGEKMGRIAQLSHETTVKKADLGRRVAIQGRDKDGVVTANEIMVDSGEWTREMADVQTEYDYAMIEKLDVADTYSNMDDALNTGNQEMYNANVDYLIEVGAETPKSGQKMKNSFGQKVNYRYASEGLIGIRESYAEHQDVDMAMKQLDEYLVMANELDLAIDSKGALMDQARSMRKNLKTEKNKKTDILLNDTVEKVANNTDDYSDYIKVRDNFSPAYAKNLSDQMEGKLQSMAVVNADAKTAMKLADSALSGENGEMPELSWDETWTALNKIKDDGIRTLASIVIAENYSEQVSSGRGIHAYDAKFGKGTPNTKGIGAIVMKSEGDIATLMHTAAFYAPSSDAVGNKSMLEDILKWKRTKMYNGVKYETMDEFREKRFAGEAMKYVEQQTARQQPDKEPVARLPSMQAIPEQQKAPKAALDYLKENPDMAPQFKEKYGYLPEEESN